MLDSCFFLVLDKKQLLDYNNLKKLKHKIMRFRMEIERIYHRDLAFFVFLRWMRSDVSALEPTPPRF